MTKKPPPKASRVPAAAPTTPASEGKGKKTAVTKATTKVSGPTAKSPKVPARKTPATKKATRKPAPGAGSPPKPAAPPPEKAKVLALVPQSPKAPAKPPKVPPPQSSALGDAIRDAIKPPGHIPGTPLPYSKSGRKSTYDRQTVDLILARLSNGEMLNQICEEVGQPLAATFRGWVIDDVDGIAERYARARELCWQWHAEEINRLSDKCRVGAKVKTGADGVEIQTEDLVSRTKLQIDTRRWLVSKLLPKQYGDKLELSGNVTMTLAERLKVLNEQEVSPHAAIPPGAVDG